MSSDVVFEVNVTWWEGSPQTIAGVTERPRVFFAGPPVRFSIESSAHSAAEAIAHKISITRPTASEIEATIHEITRDRSDGRTRERSRRPIERTLTK